MGNDMRTFGARLKMRAGADEAEVVLFARTVILEGSSELNHRVDTDRLTRAVTLEQLFAAFRQVVVRNASGQVVSCFGYDDRYNAPEPLWNAIAPAVDDGSWIAYATDDGGAILVTFDNGAALVTLMLTTPAGHELDGWGHRHVHGEGPAAVGDADADVTALVRYIAGRFNLRDGYARPNTDYRELLELLEAGEPWPLGRGK